MKVRCLALYITLVLLAAGIAPSLLRAAPPTTDGTPLSADRQTIHVLNRLAFGPRPGDLERVRQMGIERWIDTQLHPDAINDAAVDSKLARLTMLTLPLDKLTIAYTADTANFIKELMKRNKAKKQNAANNAPAGRMKPQQERLLEMIKENGFGQRASVEAVGQLQVAKIVRACESNRQLQEVMVDFWSNHFNLDAKKGPVRTLIVANERDVIRPRVFGKFRDLLGATAKSPAMLYYLDNVRSSTEIAMPPGRGTQPAVGGTVPAGGATTTPAAAQPKKVGGINENYARELMELHSLGVDGGYTQADVQEVARCLTGWTVERRTGEFVFRTFQHDNGEKHVLGQVIPAGGGIRDGEMVLDILAAHPSTAHFITRKMCVRLVADEPPTALVDRVAAVFTRTGGDLREVTRAIVTSREFFAAASYRAKIKSPFEYAVSAVRALGGQVDVPDPDRPQQRLQLVLDGATALANNKGRGRGMMKPSLVQEVASMGQPLYAYQAPTGYPEDSRRWVSTGALVARLNFALALTGGEVTRVTVSPKSLLQEANGDDHDAVLQQLGGALLGGDLTAPTRATLLKEMPVGTPANIAKVTALMLGSPEFQRR